MAAIDDALAILAVTGPPSNPAAPVVQMLAASRQAHNQYLRLAPGWVPRDPTTGHPTAGNHADALVQFTLAAQLRAQAEKNDSANTDPAWASETGTTFHDNARMLAFYRLELGLAPLAPITQDDLDALASELRGEFQQADATLGSQIQQVQTTLQGEINQLGNTVNGQLQQLHTTIDGEIQQLGSDLRIEFAKREFVLVSDGGDYNPLDFQNADLIIVTGDNPGAISGLLAGTPGQRVTIVLRPNPGETRRLWLTHNPTPPNGLNNLFKSFASPLLPFAGAASYIYNGQTQVWDMYAFDQGRIHPTGWNSGLPGWGAWRTAADPQPDLGSSTFYNVGFYIQGSKIRWEAGYSLAPDSVLGNGIWEWTGMGPDRNSYVGGVGYAVHQPGSGNELRHPFVVFSDFSESFPQLEGVGFSIRLMSLATGQFFSDTYPFAWESADAFQFTYEVLT